MYFYLSDFSCVFLAIFLSIFYRWPVSHALHRPDTESIRILGDYSEIDYHRISLARFSRLHSRSVFASCSLARTAVGRIAVSQGQSFSQTGSFIDRRSSDRETISTELLPFAVTSPSSEGLSTMRHSFRLNAHAISRSFVANCRNRDIIIFFNGSN